ncbi:hypothetical protein [Runella aurantiaca]|jgi:TRAP-type C4-dicarboxylate transport system substrate-binding protein|uniref:Uncharacterized protein n=1 Tax=Runella aurantiaca TaxID=2282308 RepID=A0A369ID80_9BACT|nr:hypothetical protein [Runella aurantiaca]RDB05453.1 hypothetical protein DVG78_12765 [Runella aurantiaca]
MSTLVLEVNQEQEKVLESLLQYMKISFQKVQTNTDFWDSLSPHVKERIAKGLVDAEVGNYTPAQDYLKQLLAQ